jgi:hypothetical protein
MKHSTIFVAFLSAFVLSGMESEQRVGLSALLDTTTARVTTPSGSFLASEVSTDSLSSSTEKLFDTIEEATLKPENPKNLEFFKKLTLFNTLCTALSVQHQSSSFARMVRRGMMLFFGAEGYHTAFMRAVNLEDSQLLTGLADDAYAHMVTIAWWQDSIDYYEALNALEKKAVWLRENNLQSAIEKLLDSEALYREAKRQGKEEVFTAWCSTVLARRKADAAAHPYQIEAPLAIEDPAQNLEPVHRAINSQEHPEKKNPLLLWFDKQIGRMGSLCRSVVKRFSGVFLRGNARKNS